MKELKNKDKDCIQESVEFLVPFTKTLVDILSTPNLKKWNLQRDLKSLHLVNLSEKDGTMNSTTKVLDFNVDILYASTRNFILTIKGISIYTGFCIIITNKGMVVNNNASEKPMPLAKDLKIEFLENYKSPYLITEVFLNYRDNYK
tara:strand:+ start:322 stop:759 length:438 start_codon:yes stop_codon:yes gene_type:complete